MFNFFNKNKPPYDVAKIKEGQFLDQAKEASPQHFFSSWMTKRPRKALVGTYFILREDEDYAYWGIPVFKRLFSDTRVIEEFFRTPKAALQDYFPNYNSIDGNTIRLHAQKAVLESDETFAGIAIYSGSFTAEIEGNHIIVTAPCIIGLKEQTVEESEKKETFEIVLDKNALALVSVQKL